MTAWGDSVVGTRYQAKADGRVVEVIEDEVPGSAHRWVRVRTIEHPSKPSAVGREHEVSVDGLRRKYVDVQAAAGTGA